MLIFLIVVCLVFGGILFVVFSGYLSDGDGFSFSEGIPRMRELPVGCLLTIMVAGAIWFLAWGVVLILALRLLGTPLGD